MRYVAGLAVFLSLLACAIQEKAKPLSEAGEKLYTVRGVVVSRSVAENSLKVDHEAIPGFKEAMTMDYQVRGASVGALPADKSRVEAKLHVTDRSYWITDVRRIP